MTPNEEMEKHLDEFTSKEGIPSDDEINKISNQWRRFISTSDLVRGLKCDKDFKMGMIIMYKRLKT